MDLATRAAEGFVNLYYETFDKRRRVSAILCVCFFFVFLTDSLWILIKPMNLYFGFTLFYCTVAKVGVLRSSYPYFSYSEVKWGKTKTHYSY